MNCCIFDFNSEDFEAFTNRIKRLLKFQNITVQNVCEYLYIEQRTYYRLMKNKKLWTDEKITVISDILGVSKFYLLYGNDNVEKIDENVINRKNADAAVNVIHKYISSLPTDQQKIIIKELCGKLMNYALELK